MEQIGCFRSGLSINQPETKKRSQDKGEGARMRVLKHATAPAVTKHNEEEEDVEANTLKILLLPLVHPWLTVHLKQVSE